MKWSKLTKRLLTALLCAAMLLSMLPGYALAAAAGERPADGSTTGQPFASGTGTSSKFRIPAMVTLDDGTIVAATDARWNTTGDGGGLDTIVSHSKDNGETWHYTFANYLGDNGNVWNGASTCFIDPALATDGTNVYMIVDLFPAGYALNSANKSPVAGENGFDDNGRLRLSADNRVSYGYYLENGKIYANDGTEQEGYTVDAFFNVTGNGVDTNLFFADSPYQVWPTDYLYLTSSSDGGATWSAPTLINAKEANEQTLLIGPGTGIVTKDGTLIFAVYEYTSGYQRTSIIYSNDNGATWSRSADATTSDWSSEAVVVELDDGTIRCFYRDAYSTLRYTDYTLVNGEYVPGSPVDTGASKTYNNQLSAIKYSQLIDGKPAILVSTADGGGNSRTNGKIYTFLLNEDNTLTLAYIYSVTTGGYAYSSLTELSDGSIGLLYENDASNGQITYINLPISTVVCYDTDVNRPVDVPVDLYDDETITIFDSTGDYSDADLTELDTDVATVETEVLTSEALMAQLGTSADYNGDLVDLSSCLYTFTANDDGTFTVTGTTADGGTVYLKPGNGGSSGYPHSTSENNVSIATGYEEGTFYVTDATHYLYFDRSNLRWDRVTSLNNNTTWMTNCSMSLYRLAADGEASSEEIPGYVRVTELDDVTAGQYLIVAPGSNGSYYAAYPSTDTSTRYGQIAKITQSGVVLGTTITIKAVGEGETSVVIGKSKYNITVTARPTETVELPVGDSYSETIPGNGSNVDVSNLDTSIATVTVTPNEETVPAANLGTDSTYTGNAIPLADCLYTFTANDDGTFTITGTAADGETVYLKPGNGSSTGYPHSTTENSLSITQGYQEGTFYMKDSSHYVYFDRSNLRWDRVTTLNNNTTWMINCSMSLYRPAADGEASSEEIPGYVRVTELDDVTEGQYLIVAPGNNGSYYAAYPSIDTSTRYGQIARINGEITIAETSELVIYAVAPGTTSILVGDTLYRIVVSAKNYTVTLDPNGGTVEPAEITVTYGEAIGELPVPTREGHTFSGWVDANGDEVTAETVYTADGNSELIAQWTVNQYTVTLDPNGGTVEPTEVTVTYGEAIGELPVPTREGYTFTGWYTENGHLVGADTTYMLPEDITLIANWTENAVIPSDPVDPEPTEPVEPEPTQPVEPEPTQPVEPEPTEPVEPEPTNPDDPTPPQTGDNSVLTFSFILLVLAACLAIFFIENRKRAAK